MSCESEVITIKPDELVPAATRHGPALLPPD